MKVDMVNRETPMLAKTGEASRRVEARLATVKPAGRKIARVYVGLLGYVYDRVHGLYQGGATLATNAVARGEQMEESLNQQFRQWGRQTSRQLQSLQNRFGANAEQPTPSVSETGGSFDVQIEAQVERVLVSLGIPTRERLERLNLEIDRPNAKLDEELARQETVHA